MLKREPLMEQAYFDEEVSYVQDEAIPKFEAKLKDASIKQSHRLSLRYNIYLKRFQLLITRYSQGEQFSRLKTSFPSVIEALEAYQLEEDSERIDFGRHIEEYVAALWLVSLGILFDVENELFEKLARLIGNEGQDKLYEKLVGTRIANRLQTENILYPVPYKLLLESISESGEKRVEKIKMFLEKWYPGMKDVYWYDRHKRPDAGFFGYWAIEAAGIVKAFNIDDTELRGLRYYPRDMLES